MAFPITHIKATSLELTDELNSLVTQKFSVLEKFIGDETDVSCDIELEKTAPSQSGNVFRAEANLFFRGKMYRAEATTDQIEKSIDRVQNQLEKELRRAQGKEHSLMKRGGAAVKKMLRFGR